MRGGRWGEGIGDGAWVGGLVWLELGLRGAVGLRAPCSPQALRISIAATAVEPEIGIGSKTKTVVTVTWREGQGSGGA